MPRRLPDEQLRALASALRAAAGAEDVRRAFAGAGRPARSDARLLRRAEKVLIADARPHLEALVRSAPPPLDRLPTSEVVDPGGRRYAIAGVAHGQRRSGRPGPALVRLVEEAVAEGLSRGEHVAVEPGFAHVFPAARGHEMKIRGREILAGLPLGRLLWLLVRLPVLVLLVPLVRMLGPLIARRDPALVLALRALRRPEWIPALLEALRLQQLPAPADLELRATAGLAAIGARYSRLMADVLRTAGAPGQDVRVVVGAGHLQHLEWLLAQADALSER